MDAEQSGPSFRFFISETPERIFLRTLTMRFSTATDQGLFFKRTLYWSDIKLVLREFETSVRPVHFELLVSEKSVRNYKNLYTENR